MIFSALNVAVKDLRSSLASFVGPSTLTEISVRPPVDGRGEISFLRLVAWSYVLLFEAGRISIPFLLRSNGAYKGQRDSIRLVHALRTWSFHNLGLASDRDLQLSQLVHRWFLSACGQSPPDGHESWNICFDRLCGLVGEIVYQCQCAVREVLLSDDDGNTVIEDLRNRIERVWPPQKFDALIGDLAIRLGIRVDAVKFRTPRIGTWRSFLRNMPEDDDPIEAITRLIERDLLKYEDGVLPISGRDIMVRFDIPPGTKVGAMLRHARDLFGAGVREKNELLARLEYRLTELRSEGSVGALDGNRSGDGAD